MIPDGDPESSSDLRQNVLWQKPVARLGNPDPVDMKVYCPKGK
jgi:hypothetical protein